MNLISLPAFRRGIQAFKYHKAIASAYSLSGLKSAPAGFFIIGISQAAVYIFQKVPLLVLHIKFQPAAFYRLFPGLPPA